MRSIPRRLAALLLLALAVVPLGAQPAAQAAQDTPPEPAQAVVTLAPVVEAEGAGTANDTPQTAAAIGSADQSWSQVVQGTLGSSGDVDYFKFTLSQPASGVKLSLSNLAADYDLVLAGDPLADQGFDPGQPGLEDVTQVGGQISAIGGQISAIGGQISAISINSGSDAEAIDTFLWLPGDYYAVVTASNGDSGDSPYTLTVQVEGSGLATPPAAPEVELRVASDPQTPPTDITTLYIVSPSRMRALYPGADNSTRVLSITTALNSLVGIGTSPAVPNPNAAGFEFGAVLNLDLLVRRSDNARVMGEFYTAWDERASNPLAANYIANLIDNVIEAATTDGVSGSGAEAPLYLGPTVTSSLVAFPNVRNVVLVGGDDVIPGFRIPDLTTIANESDYLAYLKQIDPSGVIDPSSPQGAALRYRMITSDNPYGSGRPYSFYGFPFFLPSLAVGRLVETPAEIANYLANYTYTGGSFALSDFNIELDTQNGDGKRAFVSGYDFLKDQATVVSRTLGATTLIDEEINKLINDTWTRTDLEREWFDGALERDFSATAPNSADNDSELDLFSVNSHFDHWQVLPAQESAGNFPARRLLDPTYTPGFDRSAPGGYFRDTLGYSVGCHSGYNVLGRAILPGTLNASLYEADFAQAFVKHGGNWIGNTGYGYGTADGIDYSERLSTLFTQEIARDVLDDFAEPIYIGQSIGEALRNAKQRYVRNAATLSPYDYKATHIMTLYGLPYIRTTVSNPLAPPPEDRRFAEPVPEDTPAPYRANDVGRLTRTITFEIDLDDANDRRTIARTGSTVLNLDAGDFTITDEFVQRSGSLQPFPQPGVRVFENNQVGAPTLPTFAYDISAESAIIPTQRLRVKDVIFLGGVYGQEGNFNPQITQVATETTDPIVNTAAEPRFDAGVGIWYPDKFFGSSTVGEGELQRDQLVAAAAQFRADPDGQTGTIRPYSRMVFQVIYDDPGRATAAANALRQDDQAPIIESVEIEFQRAAGQPQLSQAAQAVVLVRAYDEGPDPNGGVNSGIDVSDISAVYVRNGTVWENVSFSQREPGLFAATLPVERGAVRVIVRVSDKAGNTSYYTAKGSFQPPIDRTLVYLPAVRR